MLRCWHARTGLAALLVIVAAAFAATASAGRTSVLTGTPYAPACGVGTGFLDSLAARGGGARGEGREPNLNQVLEEVPAGQEPNTANFKATIPVYIHVIRTGQAVAQGNVPNAWIRDQIDVLNLSYAGFYGGADTGFRFRLAGVDRTTNVRWFNMTPGGADEYKAKRALRLPRLGVLPVVLRQPALDRRRHHCLRLDAGEHDSRLWGVQSRLHGHSRIGPLARAVPHVPGRL
jgi:hypothetical protein